MTAHTIHVTLLPDGRIHVDPSENPLVVAAKDTVTWDCKDTAGNEVTDLRPEFIAFLPKNITTPMSSVKDPFDGQIPSGQGSKIGPATVSSTTGGPGLYLYSIFRNGQTKALEWDTHLFQVPGFDGFFGGIPKPSGPPNN